MQITLYTQKHCPQCKVLEDKLNANHIDYQINNSLEDMSQRNITHTPMLDVDGELYDMGAAIKMINEGMI